MEREQLKQYLRGAIDLESAVLAGERAINSAELRLSDLRRKDVSIPNPVYPPKPELCIEKKVPGLPSTPHMYWPSLGDSIDIDGEWLPWVVGFLGWVGGGNLLTRYMRDMGWLRLTGWILVVIFLAPLAANILVWFILHVAGYVWRVIGAWVDYRDQVKHYTARKQERPKLIEAVKEEYQQQVALWQASVRRIDENHYALCETANVARTKRDQQYRNGLIALEKLRTDVERAKWRLGEYYRNGPLYPTYQNIVAVAQLYEYIASGIATKLEGPDGAYAQYMNDVRTQRICDNLERIREDMNDGFAMVATNQRLLLDELSECNSLLFDINRSLADARDEISIQMNSIHRLAMSSSDYMRDMTMELSHLQQGVASISENTSATAINTAAISLNQYIDMKSRGVDAYYATY